MRLTRCQAQNFMGLSDLDLNLDRGMVIVLADNGVGKSSVLKAVRIALGGWFMGVPVSGLSAPPIEPWMARYQLKRLGYELTKKHVGDVSVSGWARFPGQQDVLTWQRQMLLSEAVMQPGDSSSLRDRAVAMCLDDEHVLPLFSYYGARRYVPHQIESKLNGPEPRLLAYWGALDSSIRYGDRFGRWRRLAAQAARNPEAKEVYEALGQVLSHLLPGASAVEFDEDFGEPLVYFEDSAAGGGMRAFSSLSDGFQNILGMGLDMALRAIQLNPHLGTKVMEKTPGVILIDEIDQHLHPSWQLRVAAGFRKAFPALQFILATHSPAVALGATQFADIIRLEIHELGVKAVTLAPQDLGSTIDEVLRSEAFGLATTWSPSVVEATEERVALLRRQQQDPKDAKLSVLLEDNAHRIASFRRSPMTHTEDVVRQVLEDLAGDVDTTDASQLEDLRRRVAEAVRARRVG